MPEISVIIPAYNHAEYLSESVRSVLSQTVNDWECIIVNDGSTDQTPVVTNSFVRADSRIRCIEQNNMGLARARNRGLNEATGRYIQFLDADDWIAPNKFELQLPALQNTKALSFSYTDYEHYFEDKTLKDVSGRDYASPELDHEQPLVDLATRWENGLSIPAHCFLFDARFFTESGIRFDERLPNHEDWDCWMRILTLEPTVFYVPKVLATYRYRQDAMCANRRRMRSGFLRAIRKQKKAFRQNIQMRAVLDAKLRETKARYRDVVPHVYVYHHAKRMTRDRLSAYVPANMRRMLKRLVAH